MAFGWTDRMPRMVAAEVSGSIGAALRDSSDAPPDMRFNQPTVAVSIGATRGTYQSLNMVRRSRGAALTIGNDDIMRWQETLSRGEGLYVEPSSAAAVAAVEQLTQAGSISAQQTVVALLTASGLKDPAATAALQSDLQVLPADIGQAIAALKATGIFPH
jgi:threonine synthase